MGRVNPQLAIDWNREVSLPVSGKSPQARHASATGAQKAAGTRGATTLRYWGLLREVGPRSDHEAARALGIGVSSVNSIRNGLGDLVDPSGDYETVEWYAASGLGVPRITKRVRWRIKP